MRRTFLSTIFISITFLAYCGDTPASLSERLCAGAKNDKEKVTAIFRWITDNISYTILKKGNDAVLQYEEDDEGPLPTLDERVASAVIKRGTAFCDGYARLFKSLCDHANLRAEVIPGYARNGWQRAGSRFGVNHYWNTVYFDSAWHLLDATWASGYVTWAMDQFVRDYDPSYFLASPERFILDHFPDDPRWTLLPDHRFPDEFKQTPFRQKAFAKYHILSFTPSSGTIHARLGDTLTFRLQLDVQAAREITPDLSMDSSLFSYSTAFVFLRPEEQQERSSECGYRYVVTDMNARWLFLMFNEDLVLRYRLDIMEK